MDTALQQAQDYVRQELGKGKSADAIVQQLRGAGWTDAHIQAVFTQLQQQITPTGFAAPAASAQPAVPAPAATDRRRGRLKTGWQLFTTSLTILRGNTYLLRYLLMTGVWIFGITGAFIGIYITMLVKQYSIPSGLDFGLVALNYLTVYFVINLYAAGLTANVLDIFKGQRQPYRHYMGVARSKARPLLVFSLISATVGLFLEYVVERIRFVGWLISWLLGTVWSLGTSFVVPMIVTGDNPSGAREVKQSISFFKRTWGESITTKASVNVPLFFMQLGLMLLFFVFLIFGVTTASVWLIITICVLFIISLLVLAVIGSFANSIINIALFYYATYNEVPPAFSAELLNSVFIKRRRRLFGKKTASAA